MATPVKLAAQTREGKAKTARHAGAVPAVLYGHGLEAKSIQVDAKIFAKVYDQAGETSLIKLDTGDGAEHNVLVRDVQRHPLKDTIIHIDFYQVRMDEKIEADVPLTFVGEAPAIKNLGGILVHPLDEVRLEALPQDLPHDIEVDISGLDSFEKVIHISDLNLPKGVELDHEPDEVVALIQEPKSQEELDAELAEEIKEDVEGVEGVAEKAEEGEEGAVEGETAAEGTGEEQKTE